MLIAIAFVPIALAIVMVIYLMGGKYNATTD